MGKSTLARLLARELHATYLRIDTIEQVLRDERLAVNGPEGYAVAYQVAADNLRLGLSVVSDSVNPIRITRSAWREVATRAAVPFVEIEVICSDPAEHRARVESRSADIAGLALPTWEEVRTRERDEWDKPPIVIDTARATVPESYAALQRALGKIK